MRVAGSPIVAIQSPGELRPDVAERLQRSSLRPDSRSQSDEQAVNAFLFESSRSDQNEVARPVVASNDVSDISNRRQQRAGDEQLSQNARKALQTFSENTPSPEQQLGIELARIDIVV